MCWHYYTCSRCLRYVGVITCSRCLRCVGVITCSRRISIVRIISGYTFSLKHKIIGVYMYNYYMYTCILVS